MNLFFITVNNSKYTFGHNRKPSSSKNIGSQLINKFIEGILSKQI